ncbi:anti-sigma factor [Nocardioides sp. zg-1228]|uniref:anti-sigma factor n=1 Tax=Nocardioides sp. zg-1228 TaxID=2763008 RepID=UPI0016435663|nr:anti-sigma factor [Nocardioides sp. zg-1228]MBC2934052.1 anti-sigma factor [Nocardioides sp. zg-1228]QSF58806.1 anti-sigma factor [Nocardioides sp. zg-1228]
MADNTGDSRADVELRLPAESAFATIVRTTAAGLAARLDFTIDDIEDLRIAIGEATALVIPEADPGTDLVASFWFGRGSMTVELLAEAVDDPPLDTESFAWQVLDTMAQEASAGPEGGRFRVRFTVSSAVGAGMTGAEL